MYSRGDIVLVPFPYSDDTGAKQRPAVLISNSVVNATEDCVFVQITSKPRKDSFSYPILPDMLEEKFPPDKDLPCQVRCHKIATIEKTKIVKKVAKFSSSSLEQLTAKVLSFLQ